MTSLRAARAPLLWLIMFLAATCAAAADTPQDWLDRMNTALNTRNYVGVFTHWESGRVETLRIVHRVLDGAVTERLESLDGSGRQFVRSGAELTCYLPDQHTVLVEKAPPSLMPAGLPKFDSAMADYYLLQSEGAIRQMGEKAQVISVTPRERHAPEDRDAGHRWQCHRTGGVLEPGHPSPHCRSGVRAADADRRLSVAAR
jgi:sigma-E factor negative regulatory protein RseB